MTKILSSHTGSLPRTQKVVDFIFARENEQPYEQAGFDAAMTALELVSLYEQIQGFAATNLDIPEE